MDWNGLYLVAVGLLVGGYGWWASRSPTELERNRRSTHLIPNLASRLPGGALAFRSAYSLLAGLFLFAGVYTVLAGHPLGGASSYDWPSGVRADVLKVCTVSVPGRQASKCGCWVDHVERSVPADQIGSLPFGDTRFTAALRECGMLPAQR
jgi:hypothetical protein